MAVTSQLWMDAPESVVKRFDSSPSWSRVSGQSQEVTDYSFIKKHLHNL